MAPGKKWELGKGQETKRTNGNVPIEDIDAMMDAIGFSKNAASEVDDIPAAFSWVVSFAELVKSQGDKMKEELDKKTPFK
ncbi:MAG: hypothetical protein SFW35_04145 [Chitinophagales bacterium]|nr:hypothetical protein [Chitinophagales bacterium]